MIEVNNDDYQYLNLLIDDPYIFVLNVRKYSEKSRPALHRAWCKTLRTRKSTDRCQPFTSQGYKKLFIEELDEVHEWFSTRSICIGAEHQCSTCNPLENKIPNELPEEDILETYLIEEMALIDTLSDEKLKELLKQKNKAAEKKPLSSIRYERDATVRVAVLRRAAGICEMCNSDAPFKRKKDGVPFLEVHHVQPLSLGGYDIVSNCKAVCPNCHRKAHYG